MVGGWCRGKEWSITFSFANSYYDLTQGSHVRRNWMEVINIWGAISSWGECGRRLFLFFSCPAQADLYIPLWQTTSTIYQMHFTDFVILNTKYPYPRDADDYFANWCSCSFVFFLGKNQIQSDHNAQISNIFYNHNSVKKCKWVLWFFWFCGLYMPWRLLICGSSLGYQISVPCQGWWRLLCKLVFYWCCFL